MKKMVVTNSRRFDREYETGDLIITGNEDMDASAGYYTFGELYEHRITLFIALCRYINHDEKMTRIKNKDEDKTKTLRYL